MSYQNYVHMYTTVSKGIEPSLLHLDDIDWKKFNSHTGGGQFYEKGGMVLLDMEGMPEKVVQSVKLKEDPFGIRLYLNEESPTTVSLHFYNPQNLFEVLKKGKKDLRKEILKRYWR